ncbi:MAG: hypothetical protein OXR66_01665 [Candidatus Woesearchaeota archaeon]|nr:hypothetical protein [Candidatus Woesearchaeota archaeon]
MEFHYDEETIILAKEMTAYDDFTRKFVDILDACKIRYTLMSGYVALLFGRSRMTEDIDMFLEQITKEQFKELWEKLCATFECINTSDWESAFDDYLQENMALRFAYHGEYAPNMEVKFPHGVHSLFSLKNRREVLFNGKQLFISPLELQIPFKLHMGSDKDLEDAKHLYNFFQEHLERELYDDFLRKFNITPKTLEVLDESTQHRLG